MNRALAALIAVTLLLHSCNYDNDKKSTPLTDTDVATTFIRDILDNKINDAEQYILKDTLNMQYFESYKSLKRDKAELEKFKSADIIINEISNVSDSVTIVNYSNSYKKESKNVLKLVRIDGKWLIDFKYTFSGNM